MPDETTPAVGDGIVDVVRSEIAMSMDTTVAGAVEHVILSSMQGHAFVMEQGRLGHLDGKIGFREGLTHRIVGESGGGQARAFLPGGLGGPPTVVAQPKVG